MDLICVGVAYIRSACEKESSQEEEKFVLE
jgi:hypothetical protein